ncbi:hypothetical protein GCM10025794_23330 [Massilia kyonggiensis]
MPTPLPKCPELNRTNTSVSITILEAIAMAIGALGTMISEAFAM